MKHYEISEWADFARGLADTTRRESMGRHLAEGCVKCNRTASTFAKLAPMAAAEYRYETPEYAVHCARAIYILEQPGEVRVLSQFIGRLVFDSFREPLPAGVRSQQRISRQTLYQAGDYAVDLRQEHERGGARVMVVGQVASRSEPGRALAGVAVTLSSGKVGLARAVSNRFGEFQMDYSPARDLRLEIGAVEQEHVRTRTGQTGSQGGLA